MEILKVGISEIKPYELNAKEHPQEQIEQIKKSILEYGNNDPIAVDENNIIIEGHGRYIALQELGAETAEIIRLSHLTDEQKRAYRLIHNKLTMNSDFDFKKLEKELAELTAFDVDMSLFGFDENIFDDLNFLPQEIELEREKSGTAAKTPQLKYGSTSIYLTEEENEQFNTLLTDYLDKNGTLYGFISFLMNGENVYAD